MESNQSNGHSNGPTNINIPLDAEELALVIKLAEKAGFKSDYTRFFKDAVTRLYAKNSQGASTQNQSSPYPGSSFPSGSSKNKISSIPWTAISIAFVGLFIIIIMVMMLFGPKSKPGKKKHAQKQKKDKQTPMTSQVSHQISEETTVEPSQQNNETARSVTAQPVKTPVTVSPGDSEVAYMDILNPDEESELLEEDVNIDDFNTAKEGEKGKKPKKKKKKAKNQQQVDLNFIDKNDD